MNLVEVLLFVPVLITLAVGAYAWGRRATPGARSFIALVLAVAWWGFAYAIEVVTPPDQAVKEFWASAKFVGIVVVPVAWLAFALEYTGRGRWLTRRNVLLSLVVPAITVALSFTNAAHHLMWVRRDMVETEWFVALIAPMGAWFWAHAAYSYALTVIGTVLIVRALPRMQQVYRMQVATLLLAVVIPWFANILVVFNLNPIPYLDLTAPAFTVSTLLLAWALFRYRLLSIVPVARDLVMDNLRDAVFVVDAHNRVVDINRAAVEIVGRPATAIIGKLPSEVLPQQAELIGRYREVAEAQTEIILGDGEAQRYFDMRISPLHDRRGRLAGRLIVMTDITARRLAETLGERERRMRHRAAQLEAVAEVARAVTSVQHLDELLPRVTRVISERFNVYHVGVFLLDEAGEYAVLKAANSEGGQRMLAHDHRLRVGQTGIVGHVTAAGEPRVALDVGQDAVYFDNPDLPETHSEIALPLKVADRIIGALDVQSASESAFGEEDAAVLGTLADQVAIAIENARAFQRQIALAEENQQLLQRAERAVDELAALNRRLTGEGWQRFLIEQHAALVVEDAQPDAAARGADWPALDQATSAQDLVVASDAEHSVLAMPILLRGEVIGTIGLEDLDPQRQWSEDDLFIVKDMAEHVALTLDNARLFEESRARAEELATLNRVAEATSRTLDVKSLLEQSLSTVLAALNYEAGLVSLFDAKADTLSLVLQHGLPPALRERFEQHGLAGTLCDYVFQTGQTLVLDEVAEGAPVDVSGLIAHGLHTYVGIPLLHEDTPFGTLCVFHRGAHEGAGDKVPWLTAVGRQVGLALRNAQLFEQTQQRVSELLAINDITQALSAQQDMVSVIKLVTERVRELFHVSSAYVALYDRQAGLIQIPYLSEGDQELLVDPFPLGEGLTSHIIHTRQPLWINRDAERRAAELGAKIVGQPPRSFLGVPIFVGDEVVGVIAIQDIEREGMFGEAEQRLLATLAPSVGIAVQNARLFEQLQSALSEVRRRAQYERLVNRIVGRVRSAVSVDDVLRVAAAELRDATQTTRVAVRLDPDHAGKRPGGNGQPPGAAG